MDPRALSVLFLVGAMSLATISACFYDKYQARTGGRRVRERSLLLLALAGGSPGLVLGMLLVRHKTRKPSFLARLLLIVLIQVGFAWLLLDQTA